MKFTAHSPTTAPEASRAMLEGIEKEFGFVPNILATIAESPTAIGAVMGTLGALTNSSLSPVEKRVVMLTVGTENSCQYCVPAQSVMAQMDEMPEAILTEIRAQQSLSDTKLDALRQLVLLLMRNKGWVADNEIQEFLNAGYEKQHVLEIITLLAVMTITTYTNHLADITLDEQFMAQQWQAEERKSA